MNDANENVTNDDVNASHVQNGDSIDDISSAFFDSALLDTLFYNEMMKEDNIGAAVGEEAMAGASAQGSSVEQAAAMYSIPAAPTQIEQRQSSATAKFSRGMKTTDLMFGAESGSTKQHISQIGVRTGQSNSNHTELNQGAQQQRGSYSHPLPTIRTTNHSLGHSGSPELHQGFAPPMPYPISAVGQSSSNSATMNGAQIASLQEDYRKGVVAAAMLSQRERQEHTRSNVLFPVGEITPGENPLSGHPQDSTPGPVVYAYPNGPLQGSELALNTNATAPRGAQEFNVESQKFAPPQSKFPQPAKQIDPYAQQTLLVQSPFDQPRDRKELPQVVSLPLPLASSSTPEKAKASMLVSQFASLASQLGIKLPNHVLSSLTAAAAMSNASVSPDTVPVPAGGAIQSFAQTRDSGLTTCSVAPTRGTGDQTTTTQQKEGECDESVTARPDSHQGPSKPPGISPRAQQIQETADAAVLAVQLRKTCSQGFHSLRDNELQALTPSFSCVANEDSLSSEKAPGQKIGPSVSMRDDSANDLASFATCAQPYRKRKRPRVDECEVKLAALKDENRLLRRHLDNVLKKTQNFDMERANAERKMREMIMRHSEVDGEEANAVDKEELRQLVTRFTEMYSDYGKTRQQELKFHLQQLNKLATPTTFTKMSLWTLGQNAHFFSNPKRDSLGAILSRELQITSAQARKILERRHRVHSLSTNIKHALDLLGKLRVLCEGKQQVFHDRMSKCQEVLSPIQVVKLLMWVDDNSLVLERVCPGWGSERIRSSAASGNNKRARKDGEGGQSNSCSENR
jgi:hypothetical protein